MKKIDWKQLLQSRCPKCECKLFPNLNNRMLVCAMFNAEELKYRCDFQISPTRKDAIVSRIRLGVLSKSDEENLSELNNL